MSKKRMAPILLVLAAGGICFGLLVLGVRIAIGKDTIMTSTETGPIYNHLPDLPETSEIAWCSRSTGGIGLVNHWLYIFAFYDHDISSELSSKLQEVTVEDACVDIELYYAPDEVKGQKWRHFENAQFAFQDDIALTEKMSTQVYINETGTILYVETYWD